MVVRRPAPKRNDTDFKRFLETKKRDTIILGPIERHLLAKRTEDPHEGRDQTFIHPSELAKSDWCPRAEFYKLSGKRIVKEDTKPSFVLESIFGEGHTIHRKYQSWLWDVGMLEGYFKCGFCGHRWWGVSPDACAQVGCVAGRECLSYAEVPVWSEEYRIGGHADGQLVGGREGLEIKSIGIGTLRSEQPELLGTHTHEFNGTKFIDYDGLWDAIKRPLPSHFRQGVIYGTILGWERISFLYECKWNQRSREFIVKVNPALIEDLLEMVKDVLYALDRGGRPPACTHEDCKQCARYEDGELGDDKTDTKAPPAKRPPRRIQAPSRSNGRGIPGDRGGQGQSRQDGSRSLPTTRVRRPNAAAKHH